MPLFGSIGYVVKYPERVSRLILYGARTRLHAIPAWGGLSLETWIAMARSNWRMSQLSQLSVAEMMLGSTHDAAALQWYLNMRQEGVTGEMAAQFVTHWW